MWPLPGLAPATRQASPPGTAGSREWGLLSALFPVGLGTQNNHCPVPSRGSVNLWLLPQDVREQGSKRSVEWTLACPGSGLGPCRRGRGLGVGALHRETLASAKPLPRGSYSSCAAICFSEGHFETHETKHRLQRKSVFLNRCRQSTDEYFVAHPPPTGVLRAALLPAAPGEELGLAARAPRSRGGSAARAASGHQLGDVHRLEAAQCAVVRVSVRCAGPGAVQAAHGQRSESARAAGRPVSAVCKGQAVTSSDLVGCEVSAEAAALLLLRRESSGRRHRADGRQEPTSCSGLVCARKPHLRSLKFEFHIIFT